MKLVIKEYLASLKERDELDAIMPDLLSQIGLNVFSRPHRGSRQNGVDVGAVGCLNDKQESVYLFTIKSGNLDRESWNGKSPQALRPSIEEIVDVYINNRIPIEHKGKPIVICLCIGGYIKENVSTEVEGFLKNTSKKNRVRFEQWNGDKLSELILMNFLREDLLPINFHSLLRKSLSFTDEPEVSYKHFAKIVNTLSKSIKENIKDPITAIRQLNICLWILFSWCRESNNLESAYLSGELSLLHAWEITKPYTNKNNRKSKQIKDTFNSILNVYHLICTNYINNKVLPHSEKLYALSYAVKPSCEVDVNLKLFDILGRSAIFGIWTYQQLQISKKKKNKGQSKKLYIQLLFVSHSIKQLICNNPILFSPYKDDQAIEIALATWFLALDSKNRNFIHEWLMELTNRIFFDFIRHGKYPCIYRSYLELVEHPVNHTEEYRKDATIASILYPTLAVISAMFNFDDIYNDIQKLQNKILKHCNFQLWFPDEKSEESFYLNSTEHGAVLSNIVIDKPKEELIAELFEECSTNNYFENLSAIKSGLLPIIFICCRHYRLPIPMQLTKKFGGNATSDSE